MDVTSLEGHEFKRKPFQNVIRYIEKYENYVHRNLTTHFIYI